MPLGIPTLRDPAPAVALLDLCDALLLPGGPDVEPRRYGEELRADCRTEAVPDLDATEAAVLRRALERDLPVLAICRGCQLLNVVCGGTLWQDIAVQGAGDPAHDGETAGTPRTETVHPVVLEPDSLVSAVLLGECLHLVVVGFRQRKLPRLDVDRVRHVHDLRDLRIVGLGLGLCVGGRGGGKSQGGAELA